MNSNENNLIDLGGDDFKQKLSLLIKRKEGTKFDKKLKYDFKHKKREIKLKNKFEFVKDVCSIVNSLPRGYPGEEGYILLGVSNSGAKKGIKQSEYTDVDFIDLIEEYVAPSVKIVYETIKMGRIFIGVIYIPKSYSKPHMIKRDMKFGRKDYFAQKGICFTRNNSKVIHAQKEDLDEIYKENKKDEEMNLEAKRIDKKLKRTDSDKEIEMKLREYRIKNPSLFDLFKDVLVRLYGY